MNDWNALFTGTILGNTYALRMWNNTLGTGIETEIFVAAPGGEVIHSMSRYFPKMWGEWSMVAIKRAVLREAREDLS